METPKFDLANHVETAAQQVVTALKSSPTCDNTLLAAVLALFVNAYCKAAGPQFGPHATILSLMLRAEFVDRKPGDPREN